MLAKVSFYAEFPLKSKYSFNNLKNTTVLEVIKMSKKRLLFLALFLLVIFCFFLIDDACDEAGNCINFDGEDGYVLIQNKDSKFNGPHLTIEGWVYFEELPELSGIASVYSSSDNKRVWALVQKEGGQICFLTSPDGLSTIQGSWELSIPTKQWIHIGLAYFNGEAVLYVNGKSKGSRRAANDLFLCDQELVLGSFNKSVFFKGRMDEVRLWAKALDEEKIQGLMYSSVSGEETDLIAAYRFDEHRLGILYDTTGAFNGIHRNLMPEAIIKSDAPIKTGDTKKKE